MAGRRLTLIFYISDGQHWDVQKARSLGLKNELHAATAACCPSC